MINDFLGFDIIPIQASTYAEKVDPLYYVLCIMTVAGTAMVGGLIIWMSWKFKASDADVRPSKPLESPMLEIIWTVGPTILFLGFFVWSILLFFDFAKVPEGSLEIDVVAKQWMWKIQHADGQREVNTLHVPVNQPVALTMISQDVLHDFYVPAFRVKQDVLPGRYSKLWFEATKTGEYHLFCAEYCGTEHSLMGGTIIVMEQADYAEWLQGGPKKSPRDAGEFLFAQRGCASCHSGKANSRGPDLAGVFGTEVRLKGGQRLVVDESYLQQSIMDPGSQIVLGYSPLMPSFKNQLSAEDVNYLIAYIKSLAAEEGTD